MICCSLFYVYATSDKLTIRKISLSGCINRCASNRPLLTIKVCLWQEATYPTFHLSVRIWGRMQRAH